MQPGSRRVEQFCFTGAWQERGWGLGCDVASAPAWETTNEIKLLKHQHMLGLEKNKMTGAPIMGRLRMADVEGSLDPLHTYQSEPRLALLLSNPPNTFASQDDVFPLDPGEKGGSERQSNLLQVTQLVTVPELGFVLRSVAHPANSLLRASL